MKQFMFVQTFKYLITNKHKRKDLKNFNCYKKLKVSCEAVSSVKYNCSKNLICLKI